MKVLAIADNHIGKGLRGVPLEERLTEQEDVFRQTLTLARDRGCDVVLHGGDLFDSRRPSPEALLAVERPLLEHRDLGGCPVVMILGNHEVLSADGQTMPHAVGITGLVRLSAQPEAIPLDCGVTVCTLPWTPVSRLVAQAGGGDRDRINERAAELLVQIAGNLRREVDGPAILLAHWSVSGASLPNGLPVDQLREPVLDLDALERIGFEAIALGHIHVAGDFGVHRPIFFCGSPLPLDFGESAGKHGCYVLDTEDWNLEFLPLQHSPVEVFDWEVDGIPDEFAEALFLDGIVKVRVRTTEDRRVDVAELRGRLLEAGARSVFVQVDMERQARARVAVTEDIGPLDALAAYLTASNINGSLGASALSRAQRYLEEVKA